ncbi:heterochromatin protein 1 [Drosophila takahashii]|uniref:heterochromatin protein 1 n=1 Tax=Drosophila takahashii TaxID=29030 RepID=UPI001CF889B6|nr:heterochromatin protein 1 [Drosophila takahashii]
MEPATRKRKTPFSQDNKPVTKRTCTLSTKLTKSPNSTLIQTVKRPLKKFSSDLSNLPPVPAVDAFERGYQVEVILDMVQNSHKEQFLYIKFKDLHEPELVPLELALDRVPHLLSAFYQEYVQAWEKLEQQ